MNRVPGIPVKDWVVKNKLTPRSGYVALISIKFIKKVDKSSGNFKFKYSRLKRIDKIF